MSMGCSLCVNCGWVAKSILLGRGKASTPALAASGHQSSCDASFTESSGFSVFSYPSGGTGLFYPLVAYFDFGRGLVSIEIEWSSVDARTIIASMTASFQHRPIPPTCPACQARMKLVLVGGIKRRAYKCQDCARQDEKDRQDHAIASSRN
jgi:hypothetical protein